MSDHCIAHIYKMDSHSRQKKEDRYTRIHHLYGTYWVPMNLSEYVGPNVSVAIVRFGWTLECTKLHP